MSRKPHPCIFHKAIKPAGKVCAACGCFIRAELANKPCEGCAINTFFANQEAK